MLIVLNTWFEGIISPFKKKNSLTALKNARDDKYGHELLHGQREPGGKKLVVTLLQVIPML